MTLAASFFRNHDRVMTYAKAVKYPYLLVIGEKDVIVSGKACRDWHAMTSSADKNFKLMAGAYHETTKEPNRDVIFESALKFFAQRLHKSKEFGAFNPKKDVKVFKESPLYKKKRFWILLIVAYLCIGLLLSIVRRNKKMFLSWPALLVTAKRIMK